MRASAEYAVAAQERADLKVVADMKAAEQRTADNERNAGNAKERDDAIAAGGRDALNCQRLRKAYGSGDLPDACRD